MQIEIATPEFDDWSSLQTLLERAFAYMEGRIDPPSSLHRMSSDDLRTKAQRESLILARSDGALIGCTFAATRAHCVYIGKLAVAEQARSRGVARRMLDMAELIARRHGLQFIELQTRIELVENHIAFGRLGFEIVAETAHAGYTRPTSVTMRRRVGLCETGDA
jgi:GNAT superfamily N-acetyltransferase